VFLIGGAPNWFRGDRIRGPRLKNKHATTNEYMRIACTTAAISDPFILFNDDFYITAPMDRLPDYHRGEIDDVLNAYHEQGIRSRYMSGMARTRDRLRTLGLGTKSYELHVPMVIRKDLMLDALAIGGQRRSVYGNLGRIGGRRLADVKIYNTGQPIPPGPMLSSDDTTLRYLHPYLRDLFPAASQYEKFGAPFDQDARREARRLARLELEGSGNARIGQLAIPRPHSARQAATG
jgi:hypothetical protein